MKQNGLNESNARMPLSVPPPPPRYASLLHGAGTRLLNTSHSNWQKKADLELAEARKAEKAARSYDSFLNVEVDDEEETVRPNYSSVKEMEEDFM
jgi:hypothetical protein